MTSKCAPMTSHAWIRVQECITKQNRPLPSQNLHSGRWHKIIHIINKEMIDCFRKWWVPWVGGGGNHGKEPGHQRQTERGRYLNRTAQYASLRRLCWSKDLKEMKEWILCILRKRNCRQGEQLVQGLWGGKVAGLNQEQPECGREQMTWVTCQRADRGWAPRGLWLLTWGQWGVIRGVWAEKQYDLTHTLARSFWRLNWKITFYNEYWENIFTERKPHGQQQN